MSGNVRNDTILREARVVGLREFSTPSLEAVERRRLQLWMVMAVLLISVTAGAVLLSLRPSGSLGSWAQGPTARMGIILLAVAFCAYAIEKEYHLRKLSQLLIDEQILSAALSNRLKEVSALLDAGKAMNSVLELPAVLDAILRSALELLVGVSGSIMLAEGEELRAVCVLGNEAAQDRRIRLGEGIAGRVAVDREPLLINGRADSRSFPGLSPRKSAVHSAMCVPLVNRDELLGVLSVNAETDRRFSEYDLRALALFAEQAAGAIANARLYEAERSHVAELVEIDRLKSEFVAMVSHELRTPLTSIISASHTLMRPELADMRDELTDIIDRQAQRLAGMVEDLLDAARSDHPGVVPALEEVDLAALARTARQDFEITGRPITVDAPESVPVLGDVHTLRRIIDNLIDNAYKYGSPPVRVEIETQDSSAVMSVVDSGAGVPPKDRDRIFERFARLEHQDRHAGLGLGLPIVKGLVAACGGSVWVEDAPGGGAAFRVSLALCPARESV